jgi:predicted nucleic acid-binding protein
VRTIIAGEDVAIMPHSVFVEVVAAIRRRTGSEELATEVKEELLKIENVSFVILEQRAAEDAADIDIKKGVRGMDALVMQTAKEYKAELVTFDNEMIKKSPLHRDSFPRPDCLPELRQRLTACCD